MGGDGGGGGYATAIDGEPGSSECSDDHGCDSGGGGGGVGRIRINMVIHATTMPSCTLSPGPSTGAVTLGRVKAIPAS